MRVWLCQNELKAGEKHYVALSQEWMWPWGWKRAMKTKLKRGKAENHRDRLDSFTHNVLQKVNAAKANTQVVLYITLLFILLGYSSTSSPFLCFPPTHLYCSLTDPYTKLCLGKMENKWAKQRIFLDCHAALQQSEFLSMWCQAELHGFLCVLVTTLGWSVRSSK